MARTKTIAQPQVPVPFEPAAETPAALRTPGPWRWEINLHSKQVQLCGGRPQYDLTVMDFVRWGMNNAQPRFLLSHARPGMLLHKASEFAAVVPGREHHARWFQTLDHPDALLIAAAPDLLTAAKRILAHLDGRINAAPSNAVPLFDGIAELHDAVNKAAK